MIPSLSVLPRSRPRARLAAEPPVETLFGKKRQKLRKSVTVAVTCSEPCLATATGKLKIAKSPKRYRLKQASKLAAAGRNATLKLKLPAKARKAAKRALRRHRTVTAKITFVVQDAAANKASENRAVKLKLK